MKQSQNPVVIESLNEIQRVHKEWKEKAAGYFYILYYKGPLDNIQIQNSEILKEIKDL